MVAGPVTGAAIGMAKGAGGLAARSDLAGRATGAARLVVVASMRRTAKGRGCFG